MFLNLIVNFVPRVSRRRVDVQKHQCPPKFDFWRATSVLTLTLLPKIACMRPDPASEPINTLWPPQTRSPKTNVHHVYIKNSLSQCKQLFLIPGKHYLKSVCDVINIKCLICDYIVIFTDLVSHYLKMPPVHNSTLECLWITDHRFNMSITMVSSFCIIIKSSDASILFPLLYLIFWLHVLSQIPVIQLSEGVLEH